MSRFAPGDLVSGKYRIVRLIGDGGMGVVYEARHEVLGSSVALKFLHAELAKRPGLTQRFLQEARLSATIQSPHVTHVTDVDTAQDGSPYLVMELLSGQSLQALLDRQGRIPLEQAIDYALQILAGLEVAHAMGVVHRDLKPDNVFVTQTAGGPLLKLIDFGIAKLRASSEFTKGLTHAGVVMGTPEYMAPEQLLSAQTTDHRADIYSLGVMLFEMLAGCRPADGEDADVIVASVEAGRVRRLSDFAGGLPEGLAPVVERATSPDREQRFQSASEMRLALAPFAGQLSHAGQLAASAEAIAPMTTPASVGVVSPLSGFPAGVPRTLPPDAPALSVSQLGAARTSLSQGMPEMAPRLSPAGGTELGGPAPYAAAGGYAAPYYQAPGGALQRAPERRKRSSALLWTLVSLVVIGVGSAVGYAAYQAADQRRVVIPPLPEAALPSAAPKIEQLTAEGPLPASGQAPETGATAPTPTPKAVTAPSRATTPSSSQGGGPSSSSSGSGGSGQVVVGTGGSSSTIQLPFPLPSSIPIPTALPSSIQLPPGLGFPSGFPGVPAQPAPTATPATPNAQPAPAPTTPAPASSPTATTQPRTPRTRQSSKP